MRSSCSTPTSRRRGAALRWVALIVTVLLLLPSGGGYLSIPKFPSVRFPFAGFQVPIRAAAALVQSKATPVNTATATNTVTWDTPATAGNTLVIIVGADDYISAGNRPSGFTFSTGMGQETFLGHYLFWKVASGGETSAQYTLGSSATSAWVTAEISGLDASPYDTSNGQLVGTGSTTYTTPSITPTAGDRYIIASIGGSSAAGSMTLTNWTNSFVERQDVSTTLGSGTRDVIGYADYAVTANGSTGYSTGADYQLQTAQSRTGLIIAFKVATGGGSGTGSRMSLTGVGR